LALQVTMQAPATHTLVDPGLPPPPHAWPHVPQWLALVVRLVSQPLKAAPSQSPQPAAQVKLHVPLVHAAAVALGGNGQAAGA
jgi:hypothetical protein